MSSHPRVGGSISADRQTVLQELLLTLIDPFQTLGNGVAEALKILWFIREEAWLRRKLPGR